MAQEQKDLGAQALKNGEYRVSAPAKLSRLLITSLQQDAAKHWTCANNHLLLLDLKTMNEAQGAEVRNLSDICVDGVVVTSGSQDDNGCVP